MYVNLEQCRLTLNVAGKMELKQVQSSWLSFWGGIDGCLLVEPPALVLAFIYQARLNAIYTAKLS